MKSQIWTKAIRKSADPQRVRHFLELLSSTPAAKVLNTASPEQARIFCALFSGSMALSDWLVAHPVLAGQLGPEHLAHARRDQGFRRETDGRLRSCLNSGDFTGALSELRRFKHSEMLRIGARDLARLANQTEITRELSDLADVCIDAVTGICARQLTAKLGSPFHQDANDRWQPTGFCVIGLGKLGGQELNYNSDVDLAFVYADEGEVFKSAPRRAVRAAATSTNHAFFNRLAEKIVAELTQMTEEGTLYRVDLRLRPEGDTGPITRSLPGYENYYAQWGQTWERMMLIKARRVAGDGGLGAEFMEVVQSFRYPRSVSRGVLGEVASIKDRIENEVVRSGELDRNVKLGRGGIREIEFIAQSLQLVHAGQLPFLQVPQTLPALEKLSLYDLIEPAESMKLAAAYDFLRDVEHRLQMEDNRQTHTIPQSPAARQRLAVLMGFDRAEEFETARQQLATAVRKVFDRLFRGEPAGNGPALPREFAGNEAEWQRLLAAHSFKNPEQSVRLLNEFANGPGYTHVSNRTSDLALGLLQKFFSLCPRADAAPAKAAKPGSYDPNSKILSDPDRVLTRLDSYISAYGARSTLFEMWNSNPALFELLLLLFDRSEFLAEVAIRTPDMVDELVLSGRLRHRKTAEEILKDLRHGRNDADQALWLRQYHQTERLRIGLRDILGLADAGQSLAEITALAEACLQYSLEVVLRQLRFRRAPVAIVGFGKLGGRELNYGSDLDLVFVTEATPDLLPKLQPIAVKVMELLGARTELGSVFTIDARLRPDGEKGLLVNSLEAYEEYYRGRARLWEIQALLRSRPVAGDADTGRRFQSLAAGLTDFRVQNVEAGFPIANRATAKTAPSKARKKANASNRKGKTSGLAAYQDDWAQEIRRMRQRIEKERTPPGQDALAIKTGSGGLMDAEFLAQSFSLAKGWLEPGTLRALEQIRDSGFIPREEAGRLIENYLRLRRVEGILRRWSFEGETVLPDDPAPYYRVAIRCGFRTLEDFRQAIASWRSGIRATYERYQPTPAGS